MDCDVNNEKIIVYVFAWWYDASSDLSSLRHQHIKIRIHVHYASEIFLKFFIFNQSITSSSFFVNAICFRRFALYTSILIRNNHLQVHAPSFCIEYLSFSSIFNFIMNFKMSIEAQIVEQKMTVSDAIAGKKMIIVDVIIEKKKALDSIMRRAMKKRRIAKSE